LRHNLRKLPTKSSTREANSEECVRVATFSVIGLDQFTCLAFDSELGEVRLVVFEMLHDVVLELACFAEPVDNRINSDIADELWRAISNIRQIP
jgi:hypothetical protein